MVSEPDPAQREYESRMIDWKAKCETRYTDAVEAVMAILTHPTGWLVDTNAVGLDACCVDMPKNFFKLLQQI